MVECNLPKVEVASSILVSRFPIPPKSQLLFAGSFLGQWPTPS